MVKVFVLAAFIDGVYQVIVFRWVYPVRIAVGRVSAGLRSVSHDQRSRNRIARPGTIAANRRRGASAMNAPPDKPLDTGTRLAVDRTRLAYERTLMAWVRTAASLISFGFTSYKFFEFESGRAPSPANHLLTPGNSALS